MLGGPVAVVGLGALFPGSVDVAGFWAGILAGRDNISEVPPSHWLAEDFFDPDPSAPDKTYCKRGGFLKPVAFDPIAFGVPPSTLPATDTAQLLGLMVARKTLEDAARFRRSPVDPTRVSVVLGVASTTELAVNMNARLQYPIWRKSLREAGLPESVVEDVVARIGNHYVPWQEASFPGLLGNVVAGRIANRLDLGGTSYVTDAACASSLAALQVGLRELYLHESDMVLAGGADALNDILMYMCFSKTPAFSPTGDCRPFSDAADGTIIGEGFGMVALRRLEDAERDGDAIYAVIRGLGASSDGRATSVYAPRAEGQARALARAYENAGYSPSTVELVEAHGTATRAGDAAEFGALCSVFGPADPGRRNWCALGSVKSQIGHTKAAAGAAGLIKAVLALHHKVLPPTIKADTPNPALRIDETPFYLNTKARPWVRNPDHPRRAAVSSFGFGGSNFHVTLEEYTGGTNTPPRTRAWPTELVPLGAADRNALAAACRQLARSAAAGVTLATLASEAVAAYHPASACRVAISAGGVDELVASLERVSAGLDSGTAASFENADIAFGEGATPMGKVAFLFPGQGSQYLGMGMDVAMAFPQAADLWDCAASFARPERDSEPLHRIVFPPTSLGKAAREAQGAALLATENAQPAIAAVSLAQLRLLRLLGLQPDAVAGHSFGEVTALAAAGVFSEMDTLRVARLRGRLMAEAAKSTSGGMLAVSAAREGLLEKVGPAADGIVLANDNAPTQVVLAGPLVALDRAAEALRKQNIASRRLPVATAFHSSIVASSCAPFREGLAEIECLSPRIAVLDNAKAAAYPASPDEIRDVLAAQLGLPVRFRDMLDALYARGIRYFVEVGPGSILTGLAAACMGERPHRAIALDDRNANGDLRGWWRGLARMLADGFALNLQALAEGLEAPPRPIAPPPHAVWISGINYGRPYPPSNGAAGLPLANPEGSIPLMAFPKSLDCSGSVKPAGPVAAASLTPMHADPAAQPTAPLQPLAAPSYMAAAPSVRASVFAADTATPAMLPPNAAFAAAKPAGATREISAVEAFHQETIAAHRHFQDVMTASHRDFLAMAERALRHVAGLPLAGQGAPAPIPVDAASTHSVFRTAAAPPPLQAEIALPPVTAAPQPVAPQAPVLPTGAAIPTAIRPTASAHGPIRSGAPAVTAFTAGEPAPSLDAAALVQRIVAEKTGYPAEMLDLDMEIEAGLGIDSIKQVEILSALQEAIPGLPPIQPAELSKLRRLGDIVDRLRFTTSAAVTVANTPSATPPAASSFDAATMVRQIVAEKTGYPAEMLDLDMEIEAGLGIDSIKQVEILSALQEAIPGLPPIQPAELSKLRRLGDIVDRLKSTTSAAVTVANPPSATPSAASSFDAATMVRQIVAEKTGYPAEMLDLDMEIEAGLGIDSIKQVEILSALQEAIPGLPPIQPAELSKLRRLGDIVDRLKSTPSAAVTEPPSAPAAVPEALSTTPHASLTRTVPRCVPAPFSGFAAPVLRLAGVVYVTNEAPEIGKAIVHALQERGLEAALVAEVPHGASAAISLAALGAQSGPASALEVHRRAFHAARSLAQGKERPRLFLTLQATGGRFGLEAASVPTGAAAWSAGVSSIAKTAGREWPGATVKAIDLAAPEHAAAQVVQEIFEGGPEVEVGFDAAGIRGAVVTVEEPVSPASSPALAPGSVVVVSGGARGVTARAAEELAVAHRLRLVLLGRSPIAEWPAGVTETEDIPTLTASLVDAAHRAGHMPGMPELRARAVSLAAAHEARSTLARLQARGVEARYFSVDVADASAVSSALAEIRGAWGPVHGLVHGAGVLADKRIADLDDAGFAKVFAPKVAGLAALLEATADDPLRILALFSSVAARTGNAGQVAYAAANEVLNKIAAAEKVRRGDSCVVRSFGWGPWDGGMVDTSLKAHFERMGIGVIPMDAGAAFFVKELGSCDAATEIVVTAAAHTPPAPVSLVRYAGGLEQSYLRDHVVKGRAVLPIVMLLEWACRMGRAVAPHTGDCFGLRDLQVLSGVTFPADLSEPSPLFFEMESPPNGSGEAKIEVRDATSRTRYRTTFVTDPLPARPTVIQDGSPWPCSVAEAYADKLFHGPKFEVITKLESVSESGGSAMLRDISGMNWPAESWLTDPALLDGGMQLGALWALCMRNKFALPQRIGGYWRHQVTTGEPIRCTFTVKPVTGNRIDLNLLYATAQGRVVAEIRDVEFYNVDA